VEAHELAAGDGHHLQRVAQAHVVLGRERDVAQVGERLDRDVDLPAGERRAQAAELQFGERLTRRRLDAAVQRGVDRT
jgi:hypothetical protein